MWQVPGDWYQLERDETRCDRGHWWPQHTSRESENFDSEGKRWQND